MKLTCELCGNALEIQTAKAVCPNCGLEYSKAWLQEKRSQIRPPVVETPPVRKVPRVKEAPSKAAETKKSQKKMKTMWIILALIGLFTFFGALFSGSAQQELTVFVVSLAALLITVFVFKPWKVYGGKVI